jgi:hypothetical protein
MHAPTRKHLRRQKRRTRSIKARVVQPARAELECDAMNVSRSGATICVEPGSEVARNIELVVHSGSRFFCDLIWPRKHMIGMSFIPDHDLTNKKGCE